MTVFIVLGLGQVGAASPAEHVLSIEPGSQAAFLVAKDLVRLEGDIRSLVLSVAMTKDYVPRSISVDLQGEKAFSLSGEICWRLADGSELSMFGKSGQHSQTGGLYQASLSVLANLGDFAGKLKGMAEDGAVLELYTKQGTNWTLPIPAAFFSLLLQPK